MRMKQTMLKGVILLVLTCMLNSSYAQILNRQPFPFKIQNTSTYADDELFVAILGEDFAEVPNHVWVDCKTSEVKSMDRGLNTVPGPVYVWLPEEDTVFPARNDVEGNRNPDGTAMYASCFTRLSEIPDKTIHLPQIQGCRVYISAGEQLYLFFHGANGSPKGYAGPSHTDPTDPNQGILFEMIELTYDKWGFFANTTRVDSYNYPIGLEVTSADTTFIDPYLPRPQLTDPSNIQEIGLYKKVGSLKRHSEVANLFLENTPEEFHGCVDLEHGVVMAPSKTKEYADGSIGTMPNVGQYADYFQEYIDAIWAKYANEDLTFSAGRDAGIWSGKIHGETLTLNNLTYNDGRQGVIARKPTTQEVFEGKGALDYGTNFDKHVQAWICAAINRHVIDVTTPNVGLQDWSDDSKYYQADPCNHYAKFWHMPGIQYQQYAYGFCYDDVFNYSSSCHSIYPLEAKVSFGGYADPFNNEPVVYAGNDQELPYQTTVTNLTGSATDADGDALTYEWTKILGGSANIESTNSLETAVSELSEGTYKFLLSVSDGKVTVTDEVEVVVLGENQNRKPVAFAGNDIEMELPTNSVTLVGTGTDADNDVLTYTWTQLTGGNAIIVDVNEATTEVTNLEKGTYVFQLTVSDNEDFDTDEVTVVVKEKQPSYCSGDSYYGDYTYKVTSAGEITFVPTRTGVGNNIVILYLNGAGIIVQPNEAYPTEITSGIINFYYTYSIPEGGERNTAANPHSVDVGDCGDSSNNIPVANAGSDAEIKLPTNSIMLTGSGTDADNDILSFNWTKKSGGNANIENAYLASTMVNNLEQGTYVFELTVSDGQDSDTDEVTVIVLKEGDDELCTGNSFYGDYTYQVTSTGDITFVPTRNGVGNNIVILYLNGAGNIVQPNQAFNSGIASGNISFYYTYSIPEGGERNTAANPHLVNVGECGNSNTNHAPVANAGDDKSIQMPVNTVTLIGTGTDVDNDVLSYTWKKVSGGAATIENSTLATTNVSDLEFGTYVFRLTVNDGEFSDTDEVTVEVSVGGVCIGGPANGDYSYKVTSDGDITFVPERAGVGNNIVILYLNGAGYIVQPNEAYNSGITSGSVNFYYTYSVPEGGERNTAATPHSVNVGDCGTQKRGRIANNNSTITNAIKIYPNPAENFVNISGLSENSKVQIFNATGILQLETKESQISVSHLKPGFYILKTENEILRFMKK